MDVSVGAIPNVSLYDIDDLQSVVKNLRERENEVAKVKSIIDEELSYSCWMRCDGYQR